jgi:hypothetical protein
MRVPKKREEDDPYLRGLINSLVGECARARHNSNATRLRALFGFIRIRGCKDPSRIPIPMNEIRRGQEQNEPERYVIRKDFPRIHTGRAKWGGNMRGALEESVKSTTL